MTIECHSNAEFIDTCCELVRRGFQFTANHDTYVITFTGGF